MNISEIRERAAREASPAIACDLGDDGSPCDDCLGRRQLALDLLQALDIAERAVAEAATLREALERIANSYPWVPYVKGELIETMERPDELIPTNRRIAREARERARKVFPTMGALDAIRYARRFDNRAAIWRGLYWMLVRRYQTELCQHCGRPVRLVYHAPDWIWEAVTGRARHPDGEAASGILCPRCLDDLAGAKELPYLRWTCATTDEVMYG
jgi:hypothetical protein